MKRYEKFVLEAEKGITFEFSEGTSGKLIIRALNTATVDGYSTKYVNPPIPKGYKHVCGEWNNGFVIERCSDGSQFVWIPVGSLGTNGTLDGVPSTEKFGRRDHFDGYYVEPLTDELLLQIESVKKYGGFYFSRYNISRGSKGPQSIKGVTPWVWINFNEAKRVASTIEDTETVKSHLIFGAEYDSVLEWFIQTNARTRSEISKYSYCTDWGNYWSNENYKTGLAETGSREEWSTNNIYDLAGNVDEWTQEQSNIYCRIIRGGNYILKNSVEARIPYKIEHDSSYTGFRAALYIK